MICAPFILGNFILRMDTFSHILKWNAPISLLNVVVSVSTDFVLGWRPRVVVELSKDVDKRGEKGSYLRVPNCITSVTLTSTANVSSFNYYYKFFNMRLKRQLRMNSRSEFLRVRKDGKSYSGKYLVLGLLEDHQVKSRFKFGIIVTKKLGNAVMRT